MKYSEAAKDTLWSLIDEMSLDLSELKTSQESRSGIFQHL